MLDVSSPTELLLFYLASIPAGLNQIFFPGLLPSLIFYILFSATGGYFYNFYNPYARYLYPFSCAGYLLKMSAVGGDAEPAALAPRGRHHV